MSWFDFDPEDIWKTKQKIASGSPKDVLKIIDARTGYLYNRIQNPTEEERQQIMDATREEYSEFKRQQELWEQEIDQLEGYKSRVLSEHPQNPVETVKNAIGWGLQQFALSKLPFARPKQAPIITRQGRVIEGELADVELPFNYIGETPLLPSIYEPKLLEERALDLGPYGEYNKFIRNIQAGQEKGPPLQLLKAATGKKSPYPVTETEQRELGLFDILRTTTSKEAAAQKLAGMPVTETEQRELGLYDILRTPTSEEAVLQEALRLAESGDPTDEILLEKLARQKTITKEELLELAEARVPRLEQKLYYPAAEEGGYIQEMEPIDPLGGEDYSIMGTDEIFEEITQASTYKEGYAHIKREIGKEILHTNLVEEYNLSPYEDLNVVVVESELQLDSTEAIDLFDETVKNKTPDELMELAEKISIIRFSENPYINIRPDPAKWVDRDVKGLGIYGNKDVGWALYDMNNPILVEPESGYQPTFRSLPANRYIQERFEGDNEAAQFALQNYIRESGLDLDEPQSMEPAQGRDMGTLPNPQDYEELLVKESGETYQTKGYTQDPEHWESQFEAENAIGWSQLSTKTYASGTQGQHAEAIQSTLHQAADSPDRQGRRTGYKSDRDRDTQAVIKHLEKGLEDFEIVALPISGFSEVSGKTKFMFKGIRNLDNMKNLVKDIIVDESLEGDMRQDNIDLSFNTLKVSKIFNEIREMDIIDLDRRDTGSFPSVDWQHFQLQMATDKEEYAKLRKEYSEADFKKLARKYIIRQTAKEILSAPTTRAYRAELRGEFDRWIPVNSRYYYDMDDDPIPDLPMKGGEWRKSIWKQSINHGLNKGLTKFSWSPAWIQEIHWTGYGQEEKIIHKVADEDLTRLSKKLAKEYAEPQRETESNRAYKQRVEDMFTTEQIVITRADLASGKGGMNEDKIERVIEELWHDPKKGDIIAANDRKVLKSDFEADADELGQLQLETQNWTKILINVPVLDLTGKAAEKWLRLGYALAKGGLVQQMSSLGLTRRGELSIKPS